MKTLGFVKVEGFLSKIYERDNRSCFFIGDADIDSDGGSNPDNDPYWQVETSLKLRGESIDAEKVSGIVVPNWLPHAVNGIVLGCQAYVTNLSNSRKYTAVVHDLGPKDKDGEITPYLAKILGINPNANVGGTDEPFIFYELFPGVAALVEGIQYKLQPISAA